MKDKFVQIVVECCCCCSAWFRARQNRTEAGATLTGLRDTGHYHELSQIKRDPLDSTLSNAASLEFLLVLRFTFEFII